MENYNDEVAVGFLRGVLDEKYKRTCLISSDNFKDLVEVAKKILRLSGRPVLIKYNSFNHAGLFEELKTACSWVTERLDFIAPPEYTVSSFCNVRVGVALFTSYFPLVQFPNVDKKMPHSIFNGGRGIFLQIYDQSSLDLFEDGLIFFNHSSLEVRPGQHLYDRTGFFPRKLKDTKRYYLERKEIIEFKKFLLYSLEKSRKEIEAKI